MLGMIQFPVLLHTVTVYRGCDDECTRQKPHKGLVASNHRLPPFSPPRFPPRLLKVLFSVCLLLGLDISSESSHRPLASPSPPLFSFLLSPLLDLNTSPPFHLLCIPPPTCCEDVYLCVCVCNVML